MHRTAVRFFDDERPWLAKLLRFEEGAPDVQRLSGSAFEEAARATEWRCDHLLVHDGDLKGLLGEDVDRDDYLLANFPRSKVSGWIFLYSGNSAEMPARTRGHLVTVGYNVPYTEQAQTSGFAQLLRTFDPQYAAYKNDESAFLLLAPLDILCQGYLAAAAGPPNSPYRKEMNPVSEGLLAIPDGNEYLKKAARKEIQREIWGAGKTTGSPLSWFAMALVDEGETNGGRSSFFDAAFWTELSGLAEDAQKRLSMQLASSDETGGLELYLRLAEELWGGTAKARTAERIVEGACRSLARLVLALGRVSGADVSGIPEKYGKGWSPPTSQKRWSRTKWFETVRDAHVGYVVFANALCGE